MEITNLTVPREFRAIGVNPMAQMTLAIIWSFQKNGRPCFVSNQTLAEQLGVTPRTVINTINSLEAKKFIKVERTGKKHILTIEESIIPSNAENEAKREENSSSVKNLQSECEKSSVSSVKNLHNTSYKIPTKDTSSSSPTPPKGRDEQDKEDEDFFSKCKEIDSVSPGSSHIALYQQCKKRAIDLEEAIATLKNAVKSQKRIPANFMLACLRNDNRLPLISLPATPARVQERKQWEPDTDEEKARFEAYLAKCRAEEEGYEYAECN